jgi:tetratricopeptide (TPR) repeat protein
VVFVTVSVAAFMINSARKKEAIARDVATKHFKGIQTAMANLTDTSDELKNYPRLQPVRHMMLKLVSSYYGRLSASAETFSQTRLEHTRSLIRLGNIHSLMARHKDAIAAYQQAVDQTPQLIADSSTKTDGERLKLMALIKLSATGIATQDFERADSRLIEVIKAIETDAIFKSTADAQALLADALFTQARLHQEKGDWRKAVDLLTQARKTYEAIVGGKRSRLAKIGLATTLSTLGQSYERTGDVRSSESAFLDAQTVWNELISIDESDPKSLEGLAVSQIDLGNLLRTYGKEPLESYTEGIQRWNSLVEVRPEIPHYQFNLANAQMSLAGWLNRLGKPEAQDFAIEAINWMIRLSIAYPKDDRYRDGEAVALILLGEILRDRGQVEDSQTYLIDAWKHFDAVISKRPLPKHRERLAESLLLLGQLAESKSDTDEALRRMTAGLEQVESLLNDNKKTPQHQDIAAWAQFRLAWLDWSGGRSDMARQRVESAIELRKAMPKTAMWLESHAWLLLFSPDPKQRNPRMASELLTEATGLCPNNSRLWRTQCLVQIRLNQIVAAEVSLKKSTGSAPVEVVEKCFLLTIIRLLQGDSKAAQKQFDHGVEVMNSSCPGNPRVKSIMREAAAAIGTRPQS